jgi:hypothetical protein
MVGEPDVLLRSDVIALFIIYMYNNSNNKSYIYANAISVDRCAAIGEQ